MTSENQYGQYNPCVKCGSTSCSTRYVAWKDRIHKRCLHCFYEWNELPNDHKTKEDKSFWELLRSSMAGK